MKQPAQQTHSRVGLLAESLGGLLFREGRKGFLRLRLFNGTGAYNANNGGSMSNNATGERTYELTLALCTRGVCGMLTGDKFFVGAMFHPVEFPFHGLETLFL